jgi:hypothetical protein
MIYSLPKVRSNALKLTVVIGSFFFTINHGSALLKNEMTFHPWLSASLGFVVPFVTSVYCPCAQRISKTNSCNHPGQNG